ncbi:Protein of unknown function [Cotesia congregata]|uniref:DNA/RNA non-specific endonuclease domain-containing protein n=1 Tax=Cotesia congregata TaxID=51543 RepID=A0A8J2HEY6_COTCN|nr:Protein of unknown function [Cotesia congregata]
MPLLLHPELHRGFIYTKEPGNRITVKVGDSIRVACPGGKIYFSRGKSYESTTLECIRDKTFLLTHDGGTEMFHQIYCNKYPQHSVRRISRGCKVGVTGEIGFSIRTDEQNEFIRILDFCHDEQLGQTIYAHALIPSVIDSAEISVPRPSFTKSGFFEGISMDNIYSRSHQQETLALILGSQKLANRYIHDRGNYFLSRGHLAAKLDFIFEAQQRATFYYVNTVPMWQNINDGNWEKIEKNVRNYASRRNRNLEVWTGSLGVLELEDFEGKMKKIYLNYHDEGRVAVPVPKLLFKVVYDRYRQAGVVFITVNNPHLNRLTGDYIVCEDICTEINFPEWDMRTERGYSYCCNIDDFRNAFPYLPEFKTRRLLI